MTVVAAAIGRGLGLRGRNSLIFGVIVGAALALRIAWVIFAARAPEDFHDPLFYLFYADQISSGDGYRLLDGTPTAYYPVGYPGTLAAIFFLIRNSPIPDNFTMAAATFQVFLGVATVVLAYVIGRRVFGVAVGLLAAAWIALFPNLIFHTATYLTETLFNFLVMTALALLVLRPWRDGEVDRGMLLGAGIALGAASLVRPIALLLLPLLFLCWLLAGARWKRSTAQLGLVAVATFAVIMPWTVRNVIVMDAPLLISANLGDDLCMGHHPGAPGHFALPDHCFAGYEHLVRPEYEVQRNNDGVRKAIEYALDNPLREVKLIFLKARWTYDNDHDGLWAVESYGDDKFIHPDLRGALARIANIYFFTTLSIGGLGIMALLWRRSDQRRTILVLTALAFGAVPLAFFGDARFHVPAMPPLVFAAAWAVVESAAALRRRLAGLPAPSGIDVSERKGAVAEQDAL